MMMSWYDRFLIRPSGQVQSASQKLVQLGRKRFGSILNPAELQVLQDTANSLDLPSPEAGALRPEDPYNENTPRPEVRATFVCWLATNPEARPYIHAKGVRVYSSTITGDLDLGEHLQLPTLDFRRCNVTGRIILEASETNGIHITDCSMSKGLKADGLRVHGPVFLHRTRCEGEIRFLYARIESSLECQGAKLTAEGDSLSLDGATIDQDVFPLRALSVAERFGCSARRLVVPSNFREQS
jgi:hypothetical protein